MGEVVATYIEHKAQDLILRHESGMEPTAQIAIEVEKSRSVAQYAISVYQDCAATIPWVDLYQALQGELTRVLFQEKNIILTGIDIPQTYSTAHMRLASLMTTYSRHNESFLPRSPQPGQNKFVLIN